MKDSLSYVLALILLIFSPVRNVDNNLAKNVVAYFPNWAVYSSKYNHFSVGDIPWDKVTVINHAFFAVDEDFTLESTDEVADFKMKMAHSNSKLQGHFGEYKYYKRKYPDVKILISVGGWSRSENFHEMALTKESRAKFIESCIDFLKKYPFIDGIDIDWEYPGVARAGVSGGKEDKENFTKLLKELRVAYKSNGMEEKMLTTALPASYYHIAGKQEPDKYYRYLDFINLMTYDMHGAWERQTNHHSPIYSGREEDRGVNLQDVVKFYNQKYGIPLEKLNVGSPFYSRGWQGVKGNTGLHSKASGGAKGLLGNGGENPYWRMKELEQTEGYVKYRDDKAKVPYLYNESLGEFYTYEDEISLAERCDYINENELGGIVIWEITGDEKGTFPMINLINDKFGE